MIGVFEHVPKELEGRLVDCMLAAAWQGLVVSVATPGQGGLGHVNERPHDYVIGLLEQRGLVLDVITTMKLRGYCQLPWFQQNTLVFRRRLPTGGADFEELRRRSSCAACATRPCKYCCARCQAVWYCSAKCQCEAYGAHRRECAVSATVSASSSLSEPRRDALRDAPAFDAAVSLGPHCLSAYKVAEAGLKRRSFPFDIVMSGSDGWPAHEQQAWVASVGLSFVNECLSRDPAFDAYVSRMLPLPHIKAVGNCGFVDVDGKLMPSAHCHDDPREEDVAETYRRRALRFTRLLRSGYQTLFVYSVRLRDLVDDTHVLRIAASLIVEAGRFTALMSRHWPDFRYLLLIPVLGSLCASVSEDARIRMDTALEDIVRESGGLVAVERMADAPAGPDPMDGFWGLAWNDLFAKYSVEPRDFSESCFAEAAKSSSKKTSSDDTPARASSSKFERFVDSLKVLSVS